MFLFLFWYRFLTLLREVELSLPLSPSLYIYYYTPFNNITQNSQFPASL